MVERPDRTQTAIDGHFHFLDLPDGDYTLTASLPGTGTCYGAVEKKVQVSRNDNKIKLAAADIALPTTGIKGQITRKDSSQKSVVMAKIQVEGSGESTFSNKEGEYKLIGLQAANNVKVKVFVRGNEVTHKSETVICGEMKTLDFEL
jgi:hypothetical protein